MSLTHEPSSEPLDISAKYGGIVGARLLYKRLESYTQNGENPSVVRIPLLYILVPSVRISAPLMLALDMIGVCGC